MDVTFEYDGETFVLANDTDKWNLGECAAVERWHRMDLTDLPFVTQMLSVIAISIKRKRPKFRLQDAEQIEASLVSKLIEQIYKNAEVQEEGESKSETEPQADVEGDASPTT